MTDKEPKKKNIQALQKRYQTRFSNVRMARESAKSGDLINSIKYYNAYLKILADIHDVTPLELKPEQFNPKSELSEMLMISQVYWELTKIYDKTPKLQDDFSKVLNQFVIFTINHPYQIVNAEILRKYMRGNLSPNMHIYKAAYDKIFIESKKCYIATFAFGDSHWVTSSLRQWKLKLNQSHFGILFIRTYYTVSSRLVAACEKNMFLKFCINLFVRPFLISFTKFLNKFILNQ
jgi:hypothetical protein